MSLHIIPNELLLGNCCFNGSIFIKHNDIFQNYIPKNENIEMYIVYRTTPSREQNLNSSINIISLNSNTFKPNIKDNFKIFENISNEDPRVICLKDTLLISYNKVINQKIKYIYSGYKKYVNRLNIQVEGILISNNNFEKNNFITFKELNKKSITQKNWTFFEQNDFTLILYNIMPLEIYICNLKNTENILPIINKEWKHPLDEKLILRGGCPPIKVNNLYYVFVHSRDYKIYCLILDPYTFNILKVSKKEILPNNKEIHFPCGVIYNENNESFYISLGINDVNLGIFTINIHELDKEMININDDVVIDSKIDVIVNDNLLKTHLSNFGIKCSNVDKFTDDSHIKKIYIMDHPLKMIDNELDIYFLYVELLYLYENRDKVLILCVSNLRKNFITIKKYLPNFYIDFEDYPEIPIKNDLILKETNPILDEILLKIMEIYNILNI